MVIAAEERPAAVRSASRGAELMFRLENVPISRWHAKARIIMGSATFFDAFDALSLAFVLPVLVGLWKLTPGEVGLLIASGYLGQVIGALFFGWFAEKRGRVPSVTATVALMSVMGIACAFSGNFAMLFVLRFIQGIGVGGEVPVAASYINELSQAKGRGRFFVIYELIFPLGLMAAAQVGTFVVPRYGWEYMFLIGGIPGLIIAALMLRLPESPRWLLAKGRYDDAERVIKSIEASTTQRVLDSTADARRIAERMKELEGVELGRKKGSWKELFSPIYKKRTFVVWVLWAMSYFVANGINNWLPTLYKTVYHLPLQEALRLASISNVISVCAVLTCAMLVDKVGRRRWASACFVVAGLLLVCLATFGTGSPYGVAAFASTAYAVMGTTTVLLYLYTPEIYPTRNRALGTGLATSWLRLASATAPAIVGFVLSGGGVASVFYMFAAACLVGLVAAVQMIETTNRSLEEISP